MTLHADQVRHQAMCLIKDRRFLDAYQIFETLAPLSDEISDYSWRAICALANGNFAAALADLQTVLSRDPRHRSASYHSALILAAAPEERLRDGRRALEIATDSLAVAEQDDWRILTVVAAALAECGQFSSAVKLARDALECAPEECRVRISQRLDQYRRHEPFRITQDDIVTQLKSDPKLCNRCGASTFFSCVDSNGVCEYLCISCAQYDFAN